MSKSIEFSVSAVAVITLVAGCAHSPKLSQVDVVRLASEAATNAGCQLKDYTQPAAHFEFVRKDKSWSVFFERKSPAPPDADILVVVDDKTGKAQVVAGP